MATPAYLGSPAALAVRLGRGSYQAPPHIRLMNRQAMLLAGRHITRLVVCLPPRHGKSEFWSHYTPVWWLSLWPTARVIVASYESDFASTWGRAARNSIEANADLLPPDSHLAGDSSAMNRWHTRAGGGMVTVGAGGAITGRGADLLVIDDPYKNRQEADSPLIRRRVWSWWESTARTRLEPNAVVVLIQTRWHEDDMAGRLIADGWPCIRLPAVADGLDAVGREGGQDPIGREVGEPLWPERYDEAALAEVREEVGDYVFGALYQGLPTPTEGGGLWSRDEMREARARFMEWGEPEQYSTIVIGVDPPGGRTSCGIVVTGLLPEEREAGVKARGVVVEDCTVPAGENWGQAVVGAYHRHGADRVVVEANYGGEMVEQVIHAEDPAVPVTRVTATRGKRVRAEPVHQLYRLARAAHAERFVELENELVRWEPDAGAESPNRMDALVWCFIHLGLADPESFAESESMRGRYREPVVVRGDMVLRGRKYVDRNPG